MTKKEKSLLKSKTKSRNVKYITKFFNIITFIICILLLTYSGFKLFTWYNDSKNIKEITKEIVNDVEVEEKQPEENNTEIINPPDDANNSDYLKYINMDMLNINFDELLKKNSDTIAWIKVNGTKINYPIVQTTNNDYYLTHAYDKSTNKAGWVFADYRNNFDEFDKNTIIYAHGRVDGTMFGSLRNTLNSSWYKNSNNHIIKLSTKKSNTLWQVFSVYTIKAESYYITTRFPNDTHFEDFVNTLKERSKVLFNTPVYGNDKIITLSTCKDSKGTRIVMHAKLIKIENK